MKRVISLVLAVCMLALLFAVPLSVLAESKEVATDLALRFYCTYDATAKRVNISGKMNHDAFTKYKDATIQIYSVPTGVSVMDAPHAEGAKPIGETAVSLIFDFSFDATDIELRYSRYAVFLRSKSGELTLAANEQYPSVLYEAEHGSDRSGFKGVMSHTSVAFSADAETLILPVYLDRLHTNTTGGYVYQSQRGLTFFDKTYVDYLDERINSALASGSKVYLQLLIGNTGAYSHYQSETAKYFLADMSTEDARFLLHSAIEFLTMRYTEDAAGVISGYVLGYAWDFYSKYNATAATDIKAYAEQCALYTVITANCARSINKNIDIVLPFTSDGFFRNEAVNGVSYPTKTVIEVLLEYFEAMLSSEDGEKNSGLEFSLMIQSGDVPFGITNENISGGVDTSYSCADNCLCANCFEKLTSYLNSLSSKYSSSFVPESCIYLWTPERTVYGRALSAAYTYTYFSLCNVPQVSSFVINLIDYPEAYGDLSEIIKYINTSECNSVTASSLKLFGVQSWDELVGEISYDYRKSLIYRLDTTLTLPITSKGSFKYFDFENTVFTDGWYRGIGARTLALEYDTNGEKVLRSDLSTSDTTSEIIYKYRLHENFRYTPYLEFELVIDSLDSREKYEISVVGEGEDIRFETSAIAKAGERIKVFLDVSAHVSLCTVNSLRICIRSLSLDSQDSTLRLYGIQGYSDAYTDAELEELILEQRADADEGKDEFLTPNEIILIVVAVLLLSGTIIIGIVVCIKRSNRE